ncbi:hypothetical protein BEWA_001850 [Theileria equi strain WA]|uniref:Signal peptide containing protein n=1 Tax=Theileria equi strain WA TaxID=1537102 RepID=L0AZU0_THEEQ|nr:hypothetical protein BEWA_001850 [Theileria equi strain WA]AFZ80778.1 hypothetical protein BEWA_001850 [Theileria equi strain WA]|eukprot:XP_004830444.1 hypothetical protein BEWA_001850 [Theileria equi strain WA]
MSFIHSLLAIFGPLLLLIDVPCEGEIVSSKDIHEAQNIIAEQERLIKKVNEISERCEINGSKALKQFEGAFNSTLPYFKEENSGDGDLKDESGKFKVAGTGINNYAEMVQTYAHSQRGVLDNIQIYMDQAVTAKAKAQAEYTKTKEIYAIVKRDFEKHEIKSVNPSISTIVSCKDRISEVLNALEGVNEKLKKQISTLDFATTRLISYRYLFEILKKSRETYITSYKQQVESIEYVEKITGHLKEATSIVKRADLEIKEASKRLFQIDYTAALGLFETIKEYREAISKEDTTVHGFTEENKKDLVTMKDLFSQIRSDVKQYSEKPEKGQDKIMAKYKKIDELSKGILKRRNQSHAGKQSTFTIIVKIRKLYEDILKLLETKELKGRRREGIKLPNIDVSASTKGAESDQESSEIPEAPPRYKDIYPDGDETSPRLYPKISVYGNEDVVQDGDSVMPKPTTPQTEEPDERDTRPNDPSKDDRPAYVPSDTPKYQPPRTNGSSTYEQDESYDNTPADNKNEEPSDTPNTRVDDKPTRRADDTPTDDSATQRKPVKTEDTSKKQGEGKGIFGYFMSLIKPNKDKRGTSVQSDEGSPEPRSDDGHAIKLRQYNIKDPEIAELVQRISLLIGTDGQEVINLVTLAHEFRRQFEILKYKVEISIKSSSAFNPMTLLVEILNRSLFDICKSLLKRNEL